MDEKDKEITALRKCIVRIHEVLEEAAESELIPMFIFEEVTKIIIKAGGGGNNGTAGDRKPGGGERALSSVHRLHGE